MFILLAHNTTGTKEDGTSDYDVEIRVNDKQIFGCHLTGHIRASGGAMLLRRIDNAWDLERGAKILGEHDA